MKKRLLYIIDERGLRGGAHIATELMIVALRERGYTVDVMQAIRRDSFWGIVSRAYARVISILHVGLRLFRCDQSHQSPTPLFLRDPFGFKFRQMMRYDTVCVMAESSVLGPIVARLPSTVRKVQLIHTNYPMWAKLVKRDTEADGKVFERMNCIACVGTIGAKQFEERFPACKGKVVPFHNIIEQSHSSGERAKKRLWSVGTTDPAEGPVRLISLARINDRVAKDGPRMIRVAKRLKDAGIDFVWDNYGGSGNGFVACQQEVERLGLKDVFRIHPFDPDARAKIADADIFVLLSHYEGLPNVIYESLLAGTPVFATSVCGIPEQIQDGITGWLVPDNEDAIVSKLAIVLRDVDGLLRARNALVDYVYDNDVIVRDHEKIYFNS